MALHAENYLKKTLLKLLFLSEHTAQSLLLALFPLSALLNLSVYVDESRAPLLCEDEKPAISPSLRVRIIPLKTSQILAPCSATLGLTTGGNYTFCFLCLPSDSAPPREGTHTYTSPVHNTSLRSLLYVPLIESSCGKKMYLQTDGKCIG